MQAMVVTHDINLWYGLEMVVAAVAGCEALGASDCASAGALAAERRPELVFVDGQLPDEEVASLLQALADAAPGVICVVLAEWEMQCEPLAQAGADLVVVKGEPAQGLFKKLEGLLGRRSISLGLAPAQAEPLLA